LIFIGYGGADVEINQIIFDNLRDDCKVFLVDPFSRPETQYFIKRFKATLIRKTPENIAMEDFV